MLTLISNCDACGSATVRIVDRDGVARMFDARSDGKAVRDPAGEWWATKYRGQWTVVRPARGEDPPTSGGGVRYREHDCLRAAVAVVQASTRCDQVPVVEAPGLPPAKPDDQVAADGFRRPRGRGRGLDWPACPEQRLLTQSMGSAGGPPHQTGCIRCGRGTIRRDLDGMGWCGGEVAREEHGPPWWPGRDTGRRV